MVKVKFISSYLTIILIFAVVVVLTKEPSEKLEKADVLKLTVDYLKSIKEG